MRFSLRAVVVALAASISREEQYAQALKEQEELERQEKEQRALELRRETSTKDAAKVIAKSRAEAMKRSSARSTTTTILRSNAQLLRARAAQSTVVPDAYEDLYTLRDHYDDMYSDAVRKDREGIMRAGGYRVEEAWDRALRCAVAGLDLLPLSELSPSPGRTDIVMASA
ncbi:uncharacterized protein EDB91DRAFT_1244867 [Suillus paluster]|uniref:uncharacterized protein n=1 Tax=Suillus paluster TaxID=48578 RepID=UPI001B872EB6|nr:uncharacterized protein EDB91DRAFT_1244867 [Suillus paluster]KAG1749072.1 hypothetical protein EDB91DRAFT_1244867 [Suillus paluster]